MVLDQIDQHSIHFFQDFLVRLDILHFFRHFVNVLQTVLQDQQFPSGVRHQLRHHTVAIQVDKDDQRHTDRLLGKERFVIPRLHVIYAIFRFHRQFMADNRRYYHGTAAQARNNHRRDEEEDVPAVHVLDEDFVLAIADFGSVLLVDSFGELLKDAIVAYEVDAFHADYETGDGQVKDVHERLEVGHVAEADDDSDVEGVDAEDHIECEQFVDEGGVFGVPQADRAKDADVVVEAVL